MTDGYPRRGEVYWFDFTPSRGHEQAGHRPALVISRDAFNRSQGLVVVAAITTKIREDSPVTAVLEAGQPCPERCGVMTWQITTVSQDRIENYIGQLTKEQMNDVDRKIRLSFGL